MSFSFKRMIIVAAQGKQFGGAFPVGSDLKRWWQSREVDRERGHLFNDRKLLEPPIATARRR
jgi:hypothetical protein